MDESHKCNVRFQAKITCAVANQTNGYPGQREEGGEEKQGGEMRMSFWGYS